MLIGGQVWVLGRSSLWPRHIFFPLQPLTTRPSFGWNLRERLSNKIGFCNRRFWMEPDGWRGKGGDGKDFWLFKLRSLQKTEHFSSDPDVFVFFPNMRFSFPFLILVQQFLIFLIVFSLRLLWTRICGWKSHDVVFALLSLGHNIFPSHW